MSDVAIRVEGLGKRYRIGKRERYRALRDVLTDGLSAPFRAMRSTFRPSTNGHAEEPDTFWALKDVSFEVKRGEVLGVIGRNGAGKSTLLKILSQITEPTEGVVDIFGRVGSLLEVGTGFNPELSGRENIYLNGAILGMRKAEIDRKFDEIVDFAEIEQFLDTPVKHYSSGMYMRLAFSVAAHLEPEILLVDEVLAVGDAQFQKKCFDKMREIGRGGRTILFVSHNISAIRHICQRGLLLDGGALGLAGDIDVVADCYLAPPAQKDSPMFGVRTPRFIVNSVAVSPADGSLTKPFSRVAVRVNVTARCDIQDPGIYVAFMTIDNHRIAALDFKDFATVPRMLEGESHDIGFLIDELPLLPGQYQVELYVKDMAHHAIERVPNMFPLEVAEVPVYGGRRIDAWYGDIALRAKPLYT